MRRPAIALYLQFKDQLFTAVDGELCQVIDGLAFALLAEGQWAALAKQVTHLAADRAGLGLAALAQGDINDTALLAALQATGGGDIRLQKGRELNTL